MSETVLVKCPKCATQLKVNRPQGRFLVACPKCKQQIRIGAAASSQPSPPAANPFDNLPTPSAPSAASIPPPPPATVKAKPAKKPIRAVQPPQSQFVGRPAARPARRSKSRDLKTPLIAASCLGLILVIGVAAFLFRDKLPIESLTAWMPVLDSPEKILNDYADIADSMGTTMESIQDAESRDAAIPRIKALTERCHALPGRAVAVGPLTTEKLKSLESWFKTQIPDRSQRVKRSAERVKQMQEITNDDLLGSLIDFTFAMSKVGTTLQAAWSPIPEPTEDADQGVYELFLVRRRVWGATASVSSESGYADLGKVFDDAADDIDAIVQEHGDGLSPGAGSPYFSTSISMSMSMSSSWMDLQEEYGSLPDQAAYDRYSTALREAQHGKDPGMVAAIPAGPTSIPGFRNPHDPGDPSSMGPSQMGPGTMGPRMGPDRTGRGMGRGMGPRGRPFRPGVESDSDFEERMEKKIADYRKRSPDKAVVIRIVKSDPSSGIGEIQAMMREDLDLPAHSIESRANKGFVVMIYDGPLSDVVDHIDWGTVTSTDDSTRTIHVMQN